jgi:uncharacterized membrane protein
MPKTAKSLPWIVRVANAHRRLGASVMLGLVTAAVLPGSVSWITRILLSWDLAVLFYLAAAAVMMARSGVAAIRKRAADEDEGAFALLVLTVAAAMASLGAIFAELAILERADPHYGLYVALAIVTVVLSWAFTHTIFALHYAHDFYGGPARQDGLKFPGDQQPDYWDFIYFAFVIGMTFQVSDVAVTHKLIRRIVVIHGVLSFFFTTAIVALTVNIAANVMQR